MIRAAVIGYGNIGKAAHEALIAAPDFELAGVVEPNENLTKELQGEIVVPDISGIEKLGKIDAALICTWSRTVPEVVPQYLSKGINTVDTYDIHDSIWEIKSELDICAKANNAVSILSVGFDPGIDSVIKVLFESAAPKGITYTNFGPGMSMGHTVAVKAIDGVKNALSMTIPTGAGVHRRIVYIELKDGYDFEKVAADIKKDPYFIKDETHVIKTNNIDNLIDVGHGVNITRKGVSGQTHNQLLEFSMKINNPAMTGQFVLSSARASMKQKPGCYTVIEIPPVDFLYGGREDLIRRLV